MRPFRLAALLVALPVAGLGAQQAPTALTPAQVITAATLPLPEEMRADATVLEFAADGFTTTVIRKGTNGMTCLGPNPSRSQFHVACYADSMEPFMARGRALRKSGVKDAQVDTVRFREAKAGTLKLPKAPASLYSLTGGVFDPAAGTLTGARALYVIYTPYATTKSTGISDRPKGNAPWLMFPGTPKAHIMFTPTM